MVNKKMLLMMLELVMKKNRKSKNYINTMAVSLLGRENGNKKLYADEKWQLDGDFDADKYIPINLKDNADFHRTQLKKQHDTLVKAQKLFRDKRDVDLTNKTTELNSQKNQIISDVREHNFKKGYDDEDEE